MVNFPILQNNEGPHGRRGAAAAAAAAGRAGGARRGRRREHRAAAAAASAPASPGGGRRPRGRRGAAAAGRAGGARRGRRRERRGAAAAASAPARPGGGRRSRGRPGAAAAGRAGGARRGRSGSAFHHRRPPALPALHQSAPLSECVVLVSMSLIIYPPTMQEDLSDVHVPTNGLLVVELQWLVKYIKEHASLPREPDVRDRRERLREPVVAQGGPCSHCPEHRPAGEQDNPNRMQYKVMQDDSVICQPCFKYWQNNGTLPTEATLGEREAARAKRAAVRECRTAQTQNTSMAL